MIDDQKEVYNPSEDYGSFAENQQPEHRTHDHRAQEVRQLAEMIFESPITNIEKEWPTGKTPNPARGDGHFGYPVWQFRIYIDQVDSVNFEEVQKKIVVLQQALSNFFFEFAEEPKYYPHIKSLMIRMRQY